MIRCFIERLKHRSIHRQDINHAAHLEAFIALSQLSIKVEIRTGYSDSDIRGHQ